VSFPVMALVAIFLSTPFRARAQEAAALTEEDWRTALAAIREVALDKSETEEHRGNAIAAYARVLLRKKRHDEALELCQEVLKGADKASVAEAALRAGCLVERDRCGHLRAELDFLASSTEGSSRQPAAALSQELSRTVQMLAALAGRPMVPAPVTARLPSWAAGPGALRVPIPEIHAPAWYRFQPAEVHPALRITRPKMEPPDWYRRISFPPLEEPKAR